MHFTFIDIVFTILILFLGIMVCVKGFIKELFGKLALVAGIFAGILFSAKLSPYLENFINNKGVCLVLSFVLLFITAFLLVKIIQTIVGGIFGGEILRSLDRLLGFCLGTLEGLLLVCVVLVLIKAQPWFDLSVITNGSFYWQVLSKFLEKPILAVAGIFI
ncbi:CvpA family protein [Treponema pectinovorum]|uniref:CvpA family protein n=1 Tax=Treponema pectinovorum TaxID=164 RepID=UPI0011CCAEF4|nr:CvpA family protein [Treponema pectinovorum]